MYKEYRDTSLNSAVEQMYVEMASRHRARRSCIQIIKTAIVAAKKVKQARVAQYHDSKLKFKLFHRLPRPQSKAYASTFKAKRPCTFF
jgi:large subunit ribosomal protein L18Ae